MKYLQILSTLYVFTAFFTSSSYANTSLRQEISIDTPQFKGTFLATILNPTVCNPQCNTAIKVSSNIKKQIENCASTSCQSINITENISACRNCSIKFQKI